MEATLSDIGAYLWAVSSYWFVYMTAGPFLLDELATRFWPKFREWFENAISKPNRRRWEIAIMIVGFVAANFLAFEDEHTARKLAETKLTQSPSPSDDLKNLQADLEQERADSAAKSKEQEAEIDALKEGKPPKPFGVRLAMVLNGISPQIIQSLRGGNTVFHVTQVDSFKVHDLRILTEEADSSKYISGFATGNTYLTNQGQSFDIQFILSPALLDISANSITPTSPTPDKP